LIIKTGDCTILSIIDPDDELKQKAKKDLKKAKEDIEKPELSKDKN